MRKILVEVTILFFSLFIINFDSFEKNTMISFTLINLLFLFNCLTKQYNLLIYLHFKYCWYDRFIMASNKIKCLHILVKKNSEALMVVDRLKNGESFTNLAKELSIDKASGKRGGDLGFFRKGMMVKPFEDVAFKLEKDQISGPVKTEFGYHIIKRIS